MFYLKGSNWEESQIESSAFVTRRRIAQGYAHCIVECSISEPLFSALYGWLQSIMFKIFKYETWQIDNTRYTACCSWLMSCFNVSHQLHHSCSTVYHHSCITVYKGILILVPGEILFIYASNFIQLEFILNSP